MSNAGGRPRVYTDETVVCIAARGAVRLQRNSERRAIVELILDHGGCMSMGDVDRHYGFSMRGRIIALIHSGWLKVRWDDEEGEL